MDAETIQAYADQYQKTGTITPSLGDILGFGADLVFGNSTAQNAYNRKLVEEQRDWEKMMSDTAVQRRVADIKKAGLNPWLALNGGSLGEASTPSYSAKSYDSSSENRYTSVLKSLMSVLGDLLHSAGSVASAGIKAAAAA